MYRESTGSYCDSEERQLRDSEKKSFATGEEYLRESLSGSVANQVFNTSLCDLKVKGDDEMVNQAFLPLQEQADFLDGEQITYPLNTCDTSVD